MKDLKFEKPTIKMINDGQDNYGKFVVTPLERGFGITLGNALRNDRPDAYWTDNCVRNVPAHAPAWKRCRACR